MAEITVAEMSIGRNVRGRNVHGRNVLAETSVAEMSMAVMCEHLRNTGANPILQCHGVQRRMISVDNFFVFLRLLLFAVLLLYET